MDATTSSPPSPADPARSDRPSVRVVAVDATAAPPMILVTVAAAALVALVLRRIDWI